MINCKTEEEKRAEIIEEMIYQDKAYKLTSKLIKKKKK